MSMDEHLERVTARYDELAHLMSEGGVSGEDYATLSKEYSDLAPVVTAINAYRDAVQECADVAALIADPKTDPDMRSLAEEEFQDLKERIPELDQHIKLMMMPKDEADSRNAILEIRAGTGGDEAGLFAADLFRMYQRYADRMRWKFEIIHLQESGVGGAKEAIAEITGKNVFQRLKFESGVHRVQRVPTTESGGRIHTSAATVAVMPEAEEVDVHIEEKDLRIDTFRAQGAGGQHVNTTDSAVLLRFDVWGSPNLPDLVKQRLTVLAGSRLSKDGVLTLRGDGSRSQELNRREVRERLVALIQEATIVPKKRRPTKPSRSAKAKRVDEKKGRSTVKANRGRVRLD